MDRKGRLIDWFWGLIGAESISRQEAAAWLLKGNNVSNTQIGDPNSDGTGRDGGSHCSACMVRISGKPEPSSKAHPEDSPSQGRDGRPQVTGRDDRSAVEDQEIRHRVANRLRQLAAQEEHMKRTRLRRTSAKKRAELKERKPFLAELERVRGTLCEAQGRASANCQGIWSDGHEKFTRARGGDSLDPDTVILVCRPCHQWIHQNVSLATDRGLLIKANGRKQHGPGRPKGIT